MSKVLTIDMKKLLLTLALAAGAFAAFANDGSEKAADL